MKWIVLLLLVPSVLACVVPIDNMKISQSTEFCTGVYYLNKGIKLTESNISLDCSGAVLKSWQDGKGISIEHVENVTVKKCRILHYQTGIYVRNSTRVFLLDNHLLHNQEGTRFVVVKDSATYNHDVSLDVPFTVLESENNVISLSNRVVSGDFCNTNFCNTRQQVVEFAMVPRITISDFYNWLSEQVGGKRADRLHDWLFAEFV